MRFFRFVFVCLLAVSAMADEGLWPYNQFPKGTVKDKRGFEVDQKLLDHLRLSSVKIGNGSGAFVSPSGLLVTNRQIAGNCLAALSSKDHDYFRDGFQSTGESSEPRCTGMDASVLLKIEDVTAVVKAGGATLQQRNAAIAKIEKDCASKTGNVCTVVRLFSGGRYDLHQYRRYTDIRVVFAPEYNAAFFGKERDSISYLRYGLNIAFLRAWENGRPAATPDYLKWSATGVKDGDLVFLAGNPGPTGRLSTSAQLTFYRDTSLPLSLSRLQKRLQALNTFAASSEENLRAAQSTLSAMLMVFKRDAGKLIGLRDDRLVTRKTAFEGKIRRVVEGNTKLGAEAGKVWDDVANAYKKWKPLDREYQILEADPAPGSRLFRMARQIVRGETVDDSGDPINDTMETMMLAQYMDEVAALGEKELSKRDMKVAAMPDDKLEKKVAKGKLDAETASQARPERPPVVAAGGGNASMQAAEKMVKATRLKDPAERAKLNAKSNDPLIAFAASIDAAAQKLGRQHEEIIGALEVSATEKIAQFRLKLFGEADYPDGTSSPRVEYGVVKGYTDRAGVPQPFASTFSGLYYRKDNDGPWQVPQRWLDARASLNEVVPLDFVSTADIGGGDYGSPAVNKDGELVGVTFDGNLESLPVTFLYSDEQARAVHVDARGIAEALEKVYKASELLKELGASAPPASQ